MLLFLKDRFRTPAKKVPQPQQGSKKRICCCCCCSQSSCGDFVWSSKCIKISTTSSAIPEFNAELYSNGRFAHSSGKLIFLLLLLLLVRIAVVFVAGSCWSKYNFACPLLSHVSSRINDSIRGSWGDSAAGGGGCGCECFVVVVEEAEPRACAVAHNSILAVWGRCVGRSCGG